MRSGIGMRSDIGMYLMRKLAVFAGLVICLGAQAAVAGPSAVSDVLQSAEFKSAAAALTADHDRFVEENIRLTEIPAPPFKEEARARAYAGMMRESGLSDVAIDGIGNVIGVRPGADRRAAPLIVAAHLDTVFPEGANVKVRREGTRLSAPGIGDDSRPLALLLAFIRALAKANVRTERDVLFVGDVGEEGLGDLRGTKYLFANDVRAKKAYGFIAIEVTGFDDISTTGVGSKRYRVTFTGPGGHSSEAFGIVNPLASLATVIGRLYEIKAPASPKTTYAATVIGGGTSVNTIPDQAFLMVDLRSADSGELGKLDQAFRRIVEEAVAQENRTRDTSKGRIGFDMKSIGDRPAGHTDESLPLVRNAKAAAEAFGYTPRAGAFSSDANVPMSLGIPAISIGSGAAGGRQHAPDEWIDVAQPDSLRGMKAGLATVVASAGLATR